MLETIALLFLFWLAIASFCLRRRAERAAELATVAPMRIAFLHPDLGIGGAERLVVDAAVAAQARGHNVVVYTAHHDPSRAFAETTDGTLKVVVVGSFLPARVLGRGQVACAALRGVYGAAAIAFRAWLGWLGVRDGVDVAVVDQVPHGIPLLRAFFVPVLFYCHFPDKLLVRQPAAAPRATAAMLRAVRAAYRLPFDLLEEVCMGCSKTIVVNSAFTADVFARSFPLLARLRQRPAVLHPSVETERSAALPWPAAQDQDTAGGQPPVSDSRSDCGTPFLFKSTQVTTHTTTKATAENARKNTHPQNTRTHAQQHIKFGVNPGEVNPWALLLGSGALSCLLGHRVRRLYYSEPIFLGGGRLPLYEQALVSLNLKTYHRRGGLLTNGRYH